MDNLLREGKLLKAAKHANVVKCYDVFEPTESDPNGYIVMELMSCSLDDFMDQYAANGFSE